MNVTIIACKNCREYFQPFDDTYQFCCEECEEQHWDDFQARMDYLEGLESPPIKCVESNKKLSFNIVIQKDDDGFNS